MTASDAPRVFLGLKTGKGSVLQAQLAEAPMCVSIITEDVLCQVAVVPGQDGTGGQVALDGKPRRELPESR